MTLIENKSIHRNRAENDEAMRTLRKKRQRKAKHLGVCDKLTNGLKDVTAWILFQLRYLGIPMIKVVPSVMFRLLCFWLILSYCSEFYLNENGTGPGVGICLPAFLILVVITVQFVVGHRLGLKRQEAVVNSTNNLILPVYVDMFYLVSVFGSGNIHLKYNLVMYKGPAIIFLCIIFRIVNGFLLIRKERSTGKNQS